MLFYKKSLHDVLWEPPPTTPSWPCPPTPPTHPTPARTLTPRSPSPLPSPPSLLLHAATLSLPPRERAARQRPRQQRPRVQQPLRAKPQREWRRQGTATAALAPGRRGPHSPTAALPPAQGRRPDPAPPPTSVGWASFPRGPPPSLRHHSIPDRAPHRHRVAWTEEEQRHDVVCLAWLKRKSDSCGTLARRQDTADASASSMVGSLSRRCVATMFVDWVLVFLGSSPSPNNMPLFLPPSTLTLPSDIQFCHHPVPLAIAATASSPSCHLPHRLHTHPSAHLEGRHRTWLLHAYDEQQAAILGCRRTIQEAIHHMGNSFVGAK
jgi:hypothetical protein